ncbi:hypothetical protein PR202_ga16429 [Eleusine coracana subsp. coracana]|uniref:Protein kinase domain-containing protein n=1 Tax=Eleusine coracana subsp. coracana TaxID=191504 RepID=A0AAV5CMS6_ELECO|nr:hypothetical protein PR202_ga16429 [Eleusine coracana subsp. coracana]
MELVDGPSLRDWLTRPVPENTARAFMRQLLSAAATMHAAPMATIHRDIKPENVLVTPGCELIKLCDFGCATPAKPLGKPYPERRVGTMPYCAPEQARAPCRFAQLRTGREAHGGGGAQTPLVHGGGGGAPCRREGRVSWLCATVLGSIGRN